MDAPGWQRWLWRIAKGTLAAAILAAVGRVLYQVLTDPNLKQGEIAWQPLWLVPAGLLYLSGLGLSACFWRQAMGSLGARPSWLALLRAYYVGHLAKYIPGKAGVILVRTAMIRGSEAPTSIAAVTTVFETLTSMAAGALLAAILISLKLQREENRLWQALLLLFVAGVPTLPWVFNPLLHRLVAPFRKGDATPLPKMRFTTLFGGLVIQSGSWLLQGASLWATVRAIQPFSSSVENLLDCTAYLSIATVAGFVALSPGGLGVREYLLMVFLSPAMGGDGPAGLAALLLRLAWVTSEVLAASVLYAIPGLRRARE